MTKNRKIMPPVHLGEILLEGFIKPLRQNFYVLDLTRRSGSLSEIVRHIHRAAELLS